MPKYASLLRGINVSGQKMVKMDQLRATFESMDFQQVITYIQSGNVVFDSIEEDTGRLSYRIERELARVFGFEVPVIVRTIEELKAVIQRNPFPKVNTSENEQLYVTFLDKEPTTEAIAKLESYQNDVDVFQILNREVYLLCRKSYGRTQFSNSFIEKKLAVSATTRNWATINKLIQLAGGKEFKLE